MTCGSAYSAEIKISPGALSLTPSKGGAFGLIFRVADPFDPKGSGF
jgi:hypothetical protein